MEDPEAEAEAEKEERGYMKNLKIKVAMIENDVKQWEVAKILGIHEGSLSRKMRNELPEAEQEKIVEQIRKYRNKCNQC